MKKQIKINVKDVYTDSYVSSWPTNATDLFLFLIDKSHESGAISSPDLQKNSGGLTRCTIQKANGYDLYKAINNKSMALEKIGQRKGYKTYIFNF